MSTGKNVVKSARKSAPRKGVISLKIAAQKSGMDGDFRLRSVLDGMSEAFSLFSPDFIILDVNAAALKMDTRPRDQIVGHSHWVIYPGTENAPLGELYKRAMRERIAVTLEHRHVWEDGRVSWLDMRAYPSDDGCLAVFFRDVTDRHVAQQNARENADRFEGAVKAFADALWTNDAAGRMTGVQTGWANLTGQGFDEYQGYGWSKAVHPDDAQPTIDAWNTVVAERRLFVFEHRVRRHDGEWRRFSVRAVPVLNDDGTVREWVGVHSDVTDLRESEIRFRQLAENIDAVFYIREVEQQRTSYVSPAYERIWHRKMDELYQDAEAFTRDFHPDDRAVINDAIKRQNRGEGTDIHYRIVVPGHGVRHIHDRAFVTSNPDGEGFRVVGIAEDVTNEYLAQKKLDASAATFEKLVSENPFGLYVVDSNFKLVNASLGTQKVFAGIEPLLGRDFAELIHIIWTEPFASEAIGRFRHTLETGEPYINRSTIHERNNVDKVEAYDWRIERIALPDGTYGVVCYYYDFTERLELETKLNQALADKDMLLREIDHRVRNSITMVASLLSMQRNTTLAPEAKQALGVASSRLVAVARIHEKLYKGKSLGVVEFALYLSEICRDLHTSISHGTVKLELDTMPIDLKVDQAVPLGLVANELVTNAFKHCDDHEATIRVELRHDHDTLSLIVSDNGVGMPEDYEPSKRSGLGMKVIDLLVRQLNGKLFLPPAGSPARFVVTVPLAK